MGRILVGTCNWADHTAFYPSAYESAKNRSRKIEYYARHFPIVEIDSTFYTLQPQRNFEQWSARTPDGFVFNVKAYGELTWHHRDDNKDAVTPRAETFEKFSTMVQPLRDSGKLGAIHFQFPPWFTFGDERLDYVDTVREFFPADRIAVEFRHQSWLAPEHVGDTMRLLEARDMAYVMVDAPQVGTGTVPPAVAVTSPKLAVVRFHGRNKATWYVRNATSSADRFDYLYARGELDEWVGPIEKVASQVSEVHVLTNNNRQNYAVVNAYDLADLLHVTLPEPPPPPVLDTMRERDEAEAQAKRQP